MRKHSEIVEKEERQKLDNLDHFISNLVAETADDDYSLSFHSFLQSVEKASEKRQQVRELLSLTSNFSAYISCLVNCYSIDLDECSKEVNLSCSEILQLQKGLVTPWRFSSDQIVKLIDSINGSLDDAIGKIKNTPVEIDERQVLCDGSLLVARAENVPNSKRREGLLGASKKMLYYAQVRKKEELLKSLEQALQ